MLGINEVSPSLCSPCSGVSQCGSSLIKLLICLHELELSAQPMEGNMPVRKPAELQVLSSAMNSEQRLSHVSVCVISWQEVVWSTWVGLLRRLKRLLRRLLPSGEPPLETSEGTQEPEWGRKGEF